ncbi:MAG: MBL fold metallo-hydrolase [Actinomycetota bacterium]|nr:MBL fold metallo-hydrolase [Actinomycetota bacterium]
MPLGPTWTIGDVNITSIIETEQHWRFAWLLPSVTDDLIASVPWMKPHFVDDVGKLILRIQALVIEADGQRIIVDTCVGNDKPRPTPLFDMLDTTFLDDLKAAGFPPDTIDQVVCTHMHVDHVGWNTRWVNEAWVPTFPNARHLFGRIEYEHWKVTDESDVFGDVMGDSVAPVFDAGLAEIVESDHSLTPSVRLEPTPGHTPGHHSVHISSGGRQAVITGDMVHHPIQLPHPDLVSSADTDSAAAIASRRAAFARWEADDVLVIGTHFAGPGAGRLVAEGDGWRYDV